MTVVYEPERQHHCGPNRYGYWMDCWNDRPGTVRECDVCGKSWVAYDPQRYGYLGVKWCREGWLARRRRERRTRHTEMRETP